MKYQDRKGKSFIKPFTPKRPVKSFLDLDVYQNSLAICVTVVKNVHGQTELKQMVLEIPRLIATAHSLRFSDHVRAIAVLEDCMLKCNLSVVYLEQYRDLWRPAPDVARPLESGADVTGDDVKDKGNLGTGTGTGTGWLDEQIKNLLSLRMKIMRLQISWKKFNSFGGKE